MKIILDAMGGDNAPDAVVRGALEAAKEFGVQIVLVGRGADILASMKAQGWDTLPDGVELANAEDVVDMHSDPAAVVKQHPNSSLVLGARMLAQGGGDAFISAGNTGALLTAATLLVKRIRGIRRAAFSPVLPTKDGHAILIDAGANAECTPEFLLQFGCMGSFYAQKALGIESPRVGLLNNGAEDTKGDPLHREAHQLLKRAAEQGTIHFVGNVEARDVPFGAADVIVADGFSGNVLLKTMEGTAMFMSDMMKQMFYRNPLTMLGALLCKKGINGIRKTMDYRETGVLAMENAGQLIEDEELRAQIKGSGIGTSATRAEILKKLIHIKYLSLNKKTQIITPTLQGEMVYDVVNQSIRSLLNPELTASWEKGLTYVADGEITPDEYMQKLDHFIISRTEGVKRLNNQYQLKGFYDAAAKYYKKPVSSNRTSRKKEN